MNGFGDIPPVYGFGDAVLDIIVPISHDSLRQLGLEPGGCVSVTYDGMEKLLDIPEVAKSARRIPGGSAANVCKCLTALERSNVGFIGMVGNDSSGEEYSSALSAHAVRPFLIKCTSDASTAKCLCLITPEGERTMRTFLGAAVEFSKPDLLPSSIEMGSSGHLHCEGYCLYRPDITQYIMEKAHGASSSVSLDLASFEVVTSCFPILEHLLKRGLIDILFCNEHEASALCSSANIHLEEDTHGSFSQNDDSLKVVEAAQAWLLQFVTIVVVSRGKKGCCVADKDSNKIIVPASNVPVVDTVGAGDFFSAGFLHAWLQGAAMEKCAKCGCACGSAVVQVEGAELPEKESLLLRRKVEALLTGN